MENIIISCYQTQLSRYHMSNPCVHCPCYYPFWITNWLKFGNAPQPLLDRPLDSWMGSSHFWMYSQNFSHCFASTLGLCSCCCCTPCSLGCCKTCNFRFSADVFDVNSYEYLEQRADKDHNMFFYC